MKNSNSDDYSETKSWPNFDPIWDLDPKNFGYCLDNKDNYEKCFPNGALLGDAKLDEIIQNLTYMSNAPIGKTDNDYSTVLNYWSKNNSMTPPLLDIDEDDKINIGGGNHRFYICRGKQIDRIKFLAHPDNKEKLESILSSLNWDFKTPK
ncbi:MAG: hypothetical protein JXR20_04640 [Balneola sp.]